MHRWVARAVVAAAAASVIGTGVMASPALAGRSSSGRYEAVIGHFKTKAVAKSKKADAVRKGLTGSHKVVVQKIASNNWEVELDNGWSTKSEAEAVCKKARKLGIHCYAEKEGHGIPPEWGL
jgi:hypothetical protein